MRTATIAAVLGIVFLVLAIILIAWPHPRPQEYASTPGDKELEMTNTPISATGTGWESTFWRHDPKTEVSPLGMAPQTPLSPGRYTIDEMPESGDFVWDGTFLIDQVDGIYRKRGYITGHCRGGRLFGFERTQNPNEAFKLNISTDGKFTTIIAVDFQKASISGCPHPNPPLGLTRPSFGPPWLFWAAGPGQNWTFRKVNPKRQPASC